jgi:hypothetical protein
VSDPAQYYQVIDGQGFMQSIPATHKVELATRTMGNEGAFA